MVREMGPTDIVPAGTYSYYVYISADGVGGATRGDFTFDHQVTGEQAMTLIAGYVLTVEGKPAGMPYTVQWMFLDAMTP